MNLWWVVLEALVGGLAVAVIAGVLFYAAGLLFLSLVSVLLPLAGGPPKLLLERRRKRTRV